MLCVWLPNWPVQRLHIARPELKQQALVLHTESGRRGPEVVATSRAGRDLGIDPGVPVAEARAMAGITSIGGGVQFQIHDPWADKAALKSLSHWCQQFSPVFGIDDTDQPDSILLDLSGCVHLFGSEQQLGEQVVRSFAKRGYIVQVAIADTISAAWAVARYGDSVVNRRIDVLDQQLAERSQPVGFRNSQPAPGSGSSPGSLRIFDEDDTTADFVFVVSANCSMMSMDPLPLAALRIDSRSIATLHQLGIHTVRQLRSLPRQDLPSRFGDDIIKRIEQALGRRTEMFEPEQPPEPIEAEWKDDYPIGDRRTIEFVLTQLVDHIAETLQQRHAGARELLCRLDQELGNPVRFSVGLLRPENRNEHLQELVSMKLDAIALPPEVNRIRIRAVTTALQVAKQKSLFSLDEEADESIEFSLLINRLSNRLGTDKVLRAELVADIQPEKAANFVPLIQRDGTFTQTVVAKDHSEVVPASHRPTRLLPKPVQLNTTDAISEVPESVQWKGQQLNLASHEGPERIDTGWWREEQICRDYFRWQSTTGQRLWLFQCRRRNEWFVHGLFE